VTNRTDPPQSGPEFELLMGFWNYHRDTLRMKTAGLTAEQLAQPLPPSDLTLGGMLKHLAVVENSWFSEDLLGGPLMSPFDTAPWDDDRDWEWHSAGQDSPQELRELFDAATLRTDEIIAQTMAGPDGLDTLTVVKNGRTGEPYSLRWLMVHMVEEYSRHNGHADFLREAIDGETGE